MRRLVILQAISLWTFTLLKLQVAVSLIRLFRTMTKRLRYVLYSSVGLLLVWALVVTITTFVQCTPGAAEWNTNLKGLVGIETSTYIWAMFLGVSENHVRRWPFY